MKSSTRTRDSGGPQYSTVRRLSLELHGVVLASGPTCGRAPTTASLAQFTNNQQKAATEPPWRRAIHQHKFLEGTQPAVPFGGWFIVIAAAAPRGCPRALSRRWRLGIVPPGHWEQAIAIAVLLLRSSLPSVASGVVLSPGHGDPGFRRQKVSRATTLTRSWYLCAGMRTRTETKHRQSSLGAGEY
jgi:hypothetical protein